MVSHNRISGRPSVGARLQSAIIFSSSLNYAGPDPGTTIQVVKQVGLPDGSKYCFEYDGSFGVIKKIHYYAPDDDDGPNGVRHERRRTTYNFNFTNNDS